MYLSYKTSSLILIVASVITLLTKVSHFIPLFLFAASYICLLTQMVIDEKDRDREDMYTYIQHQNKTKTLKN